MAKTLAHITDLHLLDDAEVAQFATELPGIVASLRVAARSAKESGQSLADVFPSMTFVSELKDATLIKADGRQLEADHQTMQRLGPAQQQTDLAIAKAKDDFVLRKRPAHIDQDQLNKALLEATMSNNYHACKVFLAMGADLGSRGAHNQFTDTPLHFAARNNLDELCRLFLDEGADINLSNAKGETPMSCANFARHHAIANMISAASSLDGEEKRALRRSQRQQLAEQDDFIISQFDLDEALIDGATSGNEFVCEAMLDIGANPRATQSIFNTGEAAIHIAAQRGHERVCELLVSRGVDVNLADNHGRTPLHMAVQVGKQKNMGLLLVSLGAHTKDDISCGNLNFKGMTMHTAAMRLGSLKRMGELLEDPSQPQDQAFLAGLASEAKRLKKPEVTAFIQAHQARGRIDAIRLMASRAP